MSRGGGGIGHWNTRSHARWNPSLGGLNPTRRSRRQRTETEVDAIRTTRANGSDRTSICRRFDAHRRTVWTHAKDMLRYPSERWPLIDGLALVANRGLRPIQDRTRSNRGQSITR